MRAYLNLRLTVPERVRIFTEGLERLGYEVARGTTTRRPIDGDILVTWNRIHEGDTAARAFEHAWLPVLVAENASWGNEFAGKHWYTLARNYHNMAGMFPVGGPERWDSLGIELKPWRTSGETVVLPQRGFGSQVNAMPKHWPLAQQGRIRAHPGVNACVPLEQDLANAGKVVTWGSGAAVKALMWGIPVESHMPGWIGQQDNTDSGRLAMLRTLAHAQFTLDEIASGEPFKRLLSWQGGNA